MKIFPVTNRAVQFKKDDMRRDGDVKPVPIPE